MTGWDVSKMRASHSARYTSITALQSSTGYSRVCTEGVLCLILAGLVDPQDGSARLLSTRSARSQPLAELTIPFFPTWQLGKSGRARAIVWATKIHKFCEDPYWPRPSERILAPGGVFASQMRAFSAPLLNTSRWSAAKAQLVEHVIRNDGVTGSNPVCGTRISIPLWGETYPHDR